MLYPQLEPLACGLLDVDGQNEIYWEASGNPYGKPALYLHGGPGSGLCSGSYRQHFNPEKYYLVGIDQRGCGRSRPLATENLRDLPSNNTQALIADIQAVRSHLKIFCNPGHSLRSNDGFLLNGNAIIDRLPRIDGIPAVLIHGRRDVSGPLVTAWQLHKAWPASRLVIVEEEGHGGPLIKEHMRAALDEFCE